MAIKGIIEIRGDKAIKHRSEEWYSSQQAAKDRIAKQLEEMLKEKECDKPVK